MAKDEAGRLNVVSGIILKSTDFLRRIIAPAGGQGGVTLSYLCPNCNSFPLEDCMWWVSVGKKHCSWWCAIWEERFERRAPNRLVVVQTGDSASQAKAFKTHAVPQGVCENLIQCTQVVGKPAERWRWSNPECCDSPHRKKQERHHGGPEKLY